MVQTNQYDYQWSFLRSASSRCFPLTPHSSWQMMQLLCSSSSSTRLRFEILGSAQSKNFYDSTLLHTDTPHSPQHLHQVQLSDTLLNHSVDGIFLNAFPLEVLWKDSKSLSTESPWLCLRACGGGCWFCLRACGGWYWVIIWSGLVAGHCYSRHAMLLPSRRWAKMKAVVLECVNNKSASW